MRARYLKPAFFVDERLAELSYEWRLLRAGLDLLADRAGRLMDSPRQIRRTLFPYDEIDVDAGLSALARAGLIVRYTVTNQVYIEITDFDQTPSKREQPSVIPASNSADAILIEGVAAAHARIDLTTHKAGTNGSATARSDS